MIVTAILVVLGIALAAFLLFTVRGNLSATGKLDDVGTFTRPVDLLAFRNLTDREEEEFLRSNLSRSMFRRVERERLRAAVEYVQRAAWNAAVLLRIGESLHKEQPEMAGVGRELASAALRLRLNALAVLALLYLRLWLPGVVVSVPQLARRYEDVRDQFARVARAQRPAQVGHMLAGL